MLELASDRKFDSRNECSSGICQKWAGSSRPYRQLISFKVHIQWCYTVAWNQPLWADSHCANWQTLQIRIFFFRRKPFTSTPLPVTHLLFHKHHPVGQFFSFSETVNKSIGIISSSMYFPHLFPVYIFLPLRKNFRESFKKYNKSPNLHIQI